ncbi:restriction endonuclease subunit S [Finegoldia magna]|uniref:restriction endonuclease subunit S n=1 Tax=Finegoldia magna TaxID=1260 RepID=UPI002915BAF8|nr:restriction endonuclease subunit S [Finegoldia magna]MDU5508084.1 restriction endonuclease subunit S [Finegoldia magna]
MEFKKVKLGEIIKVQIDNRGRNPEKYINYSKFPVIDNYLIKNEKYPNIKNVNRYIDEDTKNNFLRGHLEKDDVIITLVGNGIGNVTMVPSSKCVIIQNTLGLRCNELMTNDFLYYTLISNRNKIVKYNRGSSQPSIRKTDLFSYEINVPTINYQKKITKILNSLDSKIEINNKIISNLESQAQAIFKSWFVDFEPFQDGNFVESELGIIPEGWEVKELGEVADCKLGGTPSRKKREFWNGDIPWINSGEVNKDRIIEPSEYITEDGLKNSATKLLKRKTTLVAITGATLGQVSLLEIDCCTNQSIIGIEPNEKIPYEYIYLFIKNNINKIISNQTGAAQQHINLNDIRTSKIIIPQSRIMTEYVKIVSLLMSKVEKNYFENTKLAELRDALLPKLMAGEIDVSNIKIEGEEVKNE